MNDCVEDAQYVVMGGGTAADSEPVLLVIGACARHVLPVRDFVQSHSDFYGEVVEVVEIAAFRKALAPKGFQINTLEPASA
jgi:hypothetical protein